MPFLYLAQKQNDNWIPLAAIKYIAKYLSMPYISVYEIATFYTMYNLAPVGKHFIQVCTTTPCLIRGADKIVKLCKEKISQNENEVTKNGNCSWIEFWGSWHCEAELCNEYGRVGNSFEKVKRVFGGKCVKI